MIARRTLAILLAASFIVACSASGDDTSTVPTTEAVPMTTGSTEPDDVADATEVVETTEATTPPTAPPTTAPPPTAPPTTAAPVSVDSSCGLSDYYIDYPAGGFEVCTDSWAVVVGFAASNYDTNILGRSTGWERRSSLNLGDVPLRESMDEVGVPPADRDALCTAVVAELSAWDTSFVGC